MNYGISVNQARLGQGAQSAQSLGLDDPAVNEPKSRFETGPLLWTIMTQLVNHVTKSGQQNKDKMVSCFYYESFIESNQVSVCFDFTLVALPGFGCCCSVFERFTQQTAPQRWSIGVGDNIELDL